MWLLQRSSAAPPPTFSAGRWWWCRSRSVHGVFCQIVAAETSKLLVHKSQYHLIMQPDSTITLILVAITAIGVLTDTPLLTVFGGLAACIAAFLWIARRCPLCAWAILGFINGLMGGGRRRW